MRCYRFPQPAYVAEIVHCLQLRDYLLFLAANGFGLMAAFNYYLLLSYTNIPQVVAEFHKYFFLLVLFFPFSGQTN